MALASLTPPRKHYAIHNASYEANEYFLGTGKEDLYHFFGRYYHMKSGAWEDNTAHPLPSASNPHATIDEITPDIASLPEYYIMPADEGMRQGPSEKAEGVGYAAEFTCMGFRGGLNHYQATLAPPEELADKLDVLSQCKVSIPAAFLSDACDWGMFQKPGGVEEMKHLFRMRNENVVLIEGGGIGYNKKHPNGLSRSSLGFQASRANFTVVTLYFWVGCTMWSTVLSCPTWYWV